MGKPSPEQRRDDREQAARVAEQLAALVTMTTAQLAAKLESLTGQPARVRNPTYLRKRVAWHLQAAEYGGLSEAALAKIEELAPLAMKAFNPAARRPTRPTRPTRPPREARVAAAHDGRDPRLPEPAAVLSRVYAGQIHEVTVLDDGFEYRGSRYRSLSRIARLITGTAWNGFTFFGIGARAAPPAKDSQ